MSEILIQVWDGAHEFVFLIKLLGDSDVDGPPPQTRFIYLRANLRQFFSYFMALEDC